MRKSENGRTKGLELVVERMRQSLHVKKKDARASVNAVISCLEEVLLENLGTDGFSVKLNSLGRLTVRHRAASLRKIPLTGQIRMTSKKQKVKFITLGGLRRSEKVPAVQEPVVPLEPEKV